MEKWIQRRNKKKISFFDQLNHFFQQKKKTEQAIFHWFKKLPSHGSYKKYRRQPHPKKPSLGMLGTIEVRARPTGGELEQEKIRLYKIGAKITPNISGRFFFENPHQNFPSEFGPNVTQFRWLSYMPQISWLDSDSLSWGLSPTVCTFSTHGKYTPIIV